MDINYIITLIVSTAGASTFAIYIAKTILNKSIEVGIERYKSALAVDLETHKSTLEREIESIKSNLNLVALEHQVRYTKLHEERATSIKQIFALLIDLENKLEYFTTMGQGPEWILEEARGKSARESYTTLSNYFKSNINYYPESTSTAIEEVLQLSWKIIVDMSVNKLTAKFTTTGDERVTILDEWRRLNSMVSTDIQNTKRNLLKEFQKLLGVGI
jgi:hypothetical protein